jgi:hypothetical protein
MEETWDPPRVNLKRVISPVVEEQFRRLGVAVFIGRTADKANWVELGRSYQRFALQATALGSRNAMLNQPVEVSHLRPQFAGLLGIGPQRPDLVVRFGRGPKLPVSLRRPVQAVMI